MMQIIRILQEFLMRESLEKCWNDLVDYLSNSEISLDDLYMSHLKYVNKIMQRYQYIKKKELKNKQNLALLNITFTPRIFSYYFCYKFI